jgi:selenium metabolism protein YedF
MLAQPASALKVLVDDDVSRDNVTRLAKSLGYTARVNQVETTFEISLTPGVAPEKAIIGTAKPGPTVIFIAADEMGRGDAKLGQILMKNFIFTLIESDTSPDAIYFVNNGVKLTVGSSDVIEPLVELANRGVDIASCGLCLEFFNLKETLAVGRISNMLELINALEGAGNIIRL